MMIDPSEPKILVRLSAQRFDQLRLGGGGIELAPGDLIEQILELFV
jgi:hypothetical protein